METNTQEDRLRSPIFFGQPESLLEPDAEEQERLLHQKASANPILKAKLAEPHGAAFGMVGDEWHGPKPPGPGWAEIGKGPRGGRRWKRGSSEKGVEVGDSKRAPGAIAAPTPVVGQEAQQKDEKYWNEQTNLKGLGGRLVVKNLDNKVVQHNLEQLTKIPIHVHDMVVAKGLKSVEVGEGSFTDLDAQQKWKHVTPRGWPANKTYDDVPGAYDAIGKQVLAGTKGIQGSISLPIHEYGHAIGDLFGLDNDQELIDIHKEVFTKLSPYLQQGGPGGFAGRQELIAEGFAYRCVNRNLCVYKYGTRFTEYLENKLNLGNGDL